MYAVDARDRVTELTDLPRSSVGAPLPLILASEQTLIVAYFVHAPEPEWDGTSVRVVEQTDEEPAARVRFLRPLAHLFGPPGDEDFSSHPLEARGLHPYGAFEVSDSSWIRALEVMTGLQPSSYRHFVLAFHDTTFECVAQGYSAERGVGPLSRLILG